MNHNKRNHSDGPGSARVSRAASGVSPEACVRRDAEHNKRDACAARTTQIVFAVGLSLSAILLGGCERAASAKTEAPSAVPHVQVVHVKRGEIDRRITLPGEVRAYQEAVLYAKIAGYLKSIAVDRGNWVRTNAVLAELEAPEMLADVTKAKAELDVAAQDMQRTNEAAKQAPDLVVPQMLDVARGKFAVAQANLERIQTLLNYAKIVAPFNGVITKRWVDPGAFIPAATSGSAARTAAVVTLADLDRVRIEIAVPEPEVPQVKEGLPVEVTVDELPGRTFPGTIARFAYALDAATKTMPAEIEIANADHALRPGMFAQCRIVLEKKTDAALLPAEALATEKNKAFVYAVRAGKAVRLPVRTGFDDGVSVEILDGLRPDDAVIVAGRQAITDGQAVTAVERK